MCFRDFAAWNCVIYYMLANSPDKVGNPRERIAAYLNKVAMCLRESLIDKNFLLDWKNVRIESTRCTARQLI